MRNLLTAALLLALSISSVYGEPIELNYQAVMYVRESHATKVLDKPNHLVGTGKFRGLAIFDKSLVRPRGISG